MNITIIALGKLKEKYLRDAIDEYAKRISAYGRLDIIELTPVRLSDNPSQNEIANALTKEAEDIKKKIPRKTFYSSSRYSSFALLSPHPINSVFNRFSNYFLIAC
mgnify:CR=1 FL=1